MLLLILHSILIVNQPKSYPLRVTGEVSAVQRLVRIMNDEAQTSLVEAQLINAKTNEFGVHLIQKLNNQGFLTRENRLQCALNFLFGDSSKVFRVRLVENDPVILIGDGRKSIIDIADAEKFDADPKGNFTAFNILLHELYEQYQLQIVDQIQPGRITDAQVKRAHLKAVQKESNFYSIVMLRTTAEIESDYIHIEFTSRVDSSQEHYFAYYRNGNIERVEKILLENKEDKLPK